MARRIQPKQYAHALLDMLEGADEKRTEHVLMGFGRMLRKRQQTKYVRAIISFFDKAYKEKVGIVDVLIETASPLDGVVSKKLTDHIQTLYKEKTLSVTYKITPMLIGGMVVRIGDNMIDGSVRRSMMKFRQAMHAKV